MRQVQSMSGRTSAATREEKIEEGLEHSKCGFWILDSRSARPGMLANAVGSDPGAPGWEAGEGGRGNCGSRNLPCRDPLNQERPFLPRRLDDAPNKSSLAQFLQRPTREIGLFRVRPFRHIGAHDLRATARRMEGVARPDSARALPAERGVVRAISGHGRQP